MDSTKTSVTSGDCKTCSAILACPDLPVLNCSSTDTGALRCEIPNSNTLTD
ncbi:hypothetical protein I552_1801 [Mycobacterium xenopi 3993]|nr:hypothetical protein I552_1801 [Mycobacterium xenopi 3993]